MSDFYLTDSARKKPKKLLDIEVQENLKLPDFRLDPILLQKNMNSFFPNLSTSKNKKMICFSRDSNENNRHGNIRSKKFHNTSGKSSSKSVTRERSKSSNDSKFVTPFKASKNLIIQKNKIEDAHKIIVCQNPVEGSGFQFRQNLHHKNQNNNNNLLYHNLNQGISHSMNKNKRMIEYTYSNNKRNNRSSNKIRKTSWGVRRAQSRIISKSKKKVIDPLEKAKKVKFEKIIISKMCLKNLIKMQTAKYSKMETYFGGIFIKDAIKKSKNKLDIAQIDVQLMNDIFPMTFQSEGTYSEFSSSSLEETESQSKLNSYKILDTVPRLKDISSDSPSSLTGFDLTFKDNVFMEIFGAYLKYENEERGVRCSEARSGIRRVRTFEESSRKNNGKSCLKKKPKRIQVKFLNFEYDLRDLKKDIKNQKNEMFFESFGKTFFSKNDTVENPIYKNKKFVKNHSTNKKRVYRSQNKSEQIYRGKSNHWNNKLNTEIFKSNMYNKKSHKKQLTNGKELFPQNRKETLDLNQTEVKKLIFMDHKGYPKLQDWSKLNEMDKNYLAKKYTCKKTKPKVVEYKPLNKFNSSVSNKLIYEFCSEEDEENPNKQEDSRNVQYNETNKDMVSTLKHFQREREIFKRKISINNNSRAINTIKMTSNSKIRTQSSNNGGLSSLSSTQDFLKCESSFPSLILKHSSQNSFKRENNKKLKPNHSNIKQKSKNRNSESPGFVDFSDPVKNKIYKKEPQKEGEFGEESMLVDEELTQSICFSPSNMVKVSLYKNQRNPLNSKIQNSQKLPIDEDNIFESIFSFKNEKLNNSHLNKNSSNKFNLDIENNLNIYIANSNKKRKPYTNLNLSSRKVSPYQRKVTSKKKLDQLGKLIYEQQRFIRTKSTKKQNKQRDCKENMHEIKRWNNISKHNNWEVQNESNRFLIPELVTEENQIETPQSKKNYQGFIELSSKRTNKLDSKKDHTILKKKSFNSLIKGSCDGDRSQHEEFRKRVKQRTLRTRNGSFCLGNWKRKFNKVICTKEDTYLKKCSNKKGYRSQKNSSRKPVLKDHPAIEFVYTNISNKVQVNSHSLNKQEKQRMKTRESPYDSSLYFINKTDTNVVDPTKKNKSEIFFESRIKKKLLRKNSKNRKISQMNLGLMKKEFSPMISRYGKEHPIVLVPESMVRKGEKKIATQKSRKKMNKKQNYSMFQRQSKSGFREWGES